MRIYVTLDGGTTNTRLTLVRDGEVIDSVKLSVGARSAMSEGAEYRSKIKDALLSLILKNGFCESDVHRILASGMITSEYGLCEMNHLVLPLCTKDFKQGGEKG